MSVVTFALPSLNEELDAAEAYVGLFRKTVKSLVVQRENMKKIRHALGVHADASHVRFLNKEIRRIDSRILELDDGLKSWEEILEKLQRRNSGR